MEEELKYVTVAFKPNNVSPKADRVSNMETVYEEVATGQKWDAHSEAAGTKGKPSVCSRHMALMAGLWIICVIMITVVVIFGIRLRGENVELKLSNLQLSGEKSALERRTAELSRDRERLNWTIGVILTHDNFPVSTRCPGGVCKPCEHGWLLFQSHCYLFTNHKYYSQWKSWEKSNEECRAMQAQLVVIDSLQEQLFISNHTEVYDDESHGYWMGLSSRDSPGSWSWIDGSNLTQGYWKPRKANYFPSCALSLPAVDPLANWRSASCTMRNQWICETRALIQQD